MYPCLPRLQHEFKTTMDLRQPLFSTWQQPVSWFMHKHTQPPDRRMNHCSRSLTLKAEVMRYDTSFPQQAHRSHVFTVPLRSPALTSLLLSVQVTYQSTLAGCCCPQSGLKPPVTHAVSPNRPPDQAHHPSPYRPIQCDRIRTWAYTSACLCTNKPWQRCWLTEHVFM